MNRRLGLDLGYILLGAGLASLVLKPLFGASFTPLEQTIVFCAAAICLSIGALGCEK
jgi:hypothetical protein